MKTEDTLTNGVDTSKSPEELAHEATESVELVVTIADKLKFDAVIRYKLRDVLPFIPATKRDATVDAAVNEIFSKFIDSQYKSMQSAIALKRAKAEHPEVFRASK